MAGTRTKTKGTAAASAMTAKASTAAARPTGGSHSHTPSQEMVRNRPAAVARAIAGRSRPPRRSSARAAQRCRSADPRSFGTTMIRAKLLDDFHRSDLLQGKLRVTTS
jgi:hypothetical protein